MKIKMMTISAALAVAMACTGCQSGTDSDNGNVKESSVTEATQVTTEETTTTTSAASSERTAKTTTTTTTTTAVTTTASGNTETKPAETSERASSSNEQERSDPQKPEATVSKEQTEQEVIAIPKEELVQTEPATEAEQTEIPAVTEGVIEFPFIPIG